MFLKIYCSGSIQKGASDSRKLCWTDAERHAVAQGASPQEVRFLNPDDPAHDVADSEALFGRDVFQVATADAVVVDARERRGIGIGIEMVISRLVGSFLVVVVPQDTYYRMRNVTYSGGTVAEYIHPHVLMLADAVVDDFECAGAWLQRAQIDKIVPKGREVLDAAIAAYRQRLLIHDEPMQVLLRDLERNK